MDARTAGNGIAGEDAQAPAGLLHERGGMWDGVEI